jgi:transcriptional regulator with XRE-family HTH domain
MNTTTEALKALIQDSGLSIRQFAKKQGISEQLMYQWVSAGRNTKLSTLNEIAEKEGKKVELTYKIVKL